MAEPIDPRDFGALEAEVHALTKQVDSLTNKVDSLLELANKSKGGFWMGMLIASALGGGLTLLIEWMRK